jgi:hypothetical protein
LSSKKSQCDTQRVRARGDPTTDKQCVMCFKNVVAKLSDRHCPKGALHMTVKQVRQLRSHILGKGTRVALKHLMMWLMILMGIKLFLRADEICSVQIEHFRTECAVVNTEVKRIDEIVISVKGKNDTAPVSLSIFRDDDTPIFCLLRLLLIYIAKAKITEGYLFRDMPHVEAGNNITDGMSKDGKKGKPFSYEKFLKLLKVSERLGVPVLYTVCIT